MDVLNSLARRPAPGAPFILEETTTSSQIFQAISNGQVALEAVIFALNDLADAVPGDAANAGERLSRLKMKLETARSAASVNLQNQKAEMEHAFVVQLQEKVGELTKQEDAMVP